MKTNDFILKGDICWSKNAQTLHSVSGGFLICVDGKSAGVFEQIPERYSNFPLIDYSGKLIIPGLTDLHVHAPQFVFRGLGMDLELLEWLETRAFPEEAKYADLKYARQSYAAFAAAVQKGPNTRLVVFATFHTPATLMLMDMLEEAGLVCLIGKVNMDRNCPDILREANAAASLDATEKWLDAVAHNKYRNVRPILTPRFIPSCSNKLMRGLAELQKKYRLPAQSHLSENRKEIEWVRQLCPESSGYGDACRRFGIFDGPAVMAHCVWSDEKEIALLAEKQVFVAHCPQSNTNLSSGIAPVRRFLDTGVPVGLGSDIAGGVHGSIFRAMSDAVQVSKLRQVLMQQDISHNDDKALTLGEAFYLGTAGGGAFFSRCELNSSGVFESGADFDALVINDKDLSLPFALSIRERLERVVYLSEDRHIEAKYVRGKNLFNAF